ncbi:MAG: thioesterase family protein [Pseudomonadota bacterium]|nr:thioesterase family protein [Pseudomonadota bacterium]
MIFSEVLDSVRASADGFVADIGDDWLQGRTAFGGLQSALAIRALRQVIGNDIPLRVVQTTFMAPVPGGVVQLQPRVLRVGKSATHAECRIVLDGQVLCLVIAVFGSTRESTVQVAPARPEKPAAEQAKELPYIPGVVPVFTQHFSMRWAEGRFPFTGASDPRTVIHVRHREEQTLGEGHLIALADTVPSPGLSLLKKPAMASSMTWTLELLDHDFDVAHDAHWRMDTEVTAAANGYMAQSASLWSPKGKLAALSRQSVVVFG